MRYAIERMCLIVVLAGIVVCPTLDARATIQDDSCIYPDVEYPMPCDEDDEDDD